MISILPPALVIFSSADLENLCACTVSAVFNSPSPRTLIRSFLCTTPILMQEFRRNVLFAQLGQPVQVHDLIFLAENVGEAALGQAAMQRHLAAFEAAHHARA